MTGETNDWQAQSRCRPRTVRSRGQSLVELAITAPVLLLLFSGTLDLGRAYYFTVLSSDAARNSVRTLIGVYAPSAAGPSLSVVCSEAQADLKNVSSVTCNQVTHAPPYVAGTDYTQPSANNAVVLVYCGSHAISGTCGSTTGGAAFHDTVAVWVFYGYSLLTPWVSSLEPGGIIQMQRGAQMVTNW
jgi:Flp pilus assembly protein TadG